MATILVTGGTGTLGRALVDRLLDDGHDVRSLSRRPHTGTERPAAAGVRGRPAGRHRAWTRRWRAWTRSCTARLAPAGGDTEAAGRLVAAAKAAGVPHLVYISIVGVDRVPIGYYRTKLAVERTIEDSGLGWTVLRDDAVPRSGARVVKAGARSPVLPVPTGVRVQPVEVREVADRLAELAAGAAGRAGSPTWAGPRCWTARELAQATLEAGGRRRLLMPLWLPGSTFAALRRGGNLTPEHADGRRTYAEFLAERAGAGPAR